MSTSTETELIERTAKIEERIDTLAAHVEALRSRDYWVRLATTLLAGAALAYGLGERVASGAHAVAATAQEVLK